MCPVLMNTNVCYVSAVTNMINKEYLYTLSDFEGIYIIDNILYNTI